jgi:hypothetical protein
MVELAKPRRGGYRQAMGVFVGLCLFAGCALIAWSVFFVGRRIARVLWGILIVAEKDEKQRAIYEEQERRLFR